MESRRENLSKNEYPNQGDVESLSVLPRICAGREDLTDKEAATKRINILTNFLWLHSASCSLNPYEGR